MFYNIKLSTFALAFENERWQRSDGRQAENQKNEKIGKIFCQFKNLSYLCKVFGPLKRAKQNGHWNNCNRRSSTRAKSSSQFTITISINRSGIERRCSIIKSEKIKNDINNEEFDPGSGWTLATGLTHASRGAAGMLAITFAGDRRTGE